MQRQQSATAVPRYQKRVKHFLENSPWLGLSFLLIVVALSLSGGVVTIVSAYSTEQTLTTLDSDTSGLVRINTLRWRVWKAHETLTRGIEQYETQPATPVIESSFDIETRVHMDLFSLDLDFIAESFPQVSADVREKVLAYAALLGDGLDSRGIPEGFDAALVALDARLGEEHESVLSNMKAELQLKRDESETELAFNITALGVVVILRVIIAILFAMADGWGKFGQAVRTLTRRRQGQGQHQPETENKEKEKEKEKDKNVEEEKQEQQKEEKPAKLQRKRTTLNFSRTAISTAALALVVDACHGGNAVLIVQVNSEILAQVATASLPLLESAMQIEYIDPILTGSASRFVLSDATATEWVDRYDAIVVDLDAAIALQGETSSLPVDGLFNAYIDEKNTVLVEKETIALSGDADISRADRFDAIYGRSYLVAKTQYLAASADYRVQQLQSVRAGLTSGVNVAAILLMISSFLLALIVLGVLPEIVKDGLETIRWAREQKPMEGLMKSVRNLTRPKGEKGGVGEGGGSLQDSCVDMEKGGRGDEEGGGPESSVPVRVDDPLPQQAIREGPVSREMSRDENGKRTHGEKEEGLSSSKEEGSDKFGLQFPPKASQAETAQVAPSIRKETGKVIEPGDVLMVPQPERGHFRTDSASVPSMPNLSNKPSPVRNIVESEEASLYSGSSS